MSQELTRRSFISGTATAALATLAGCGGLTEPDNGFIEFRSGAVLSICAVGTIHLFIDNAEVGTMSAGQSRSFSAKPGSHTVKANDNTGSWGPQSVTVTSGATVGYTLNC